MCLAQDSGSPVLKKNSALGPGHVTKVLVGGGCVVFPPSISLDWEVCCWHTQYSRLYLYTRPFIWRSPLLNSWSGCRDMCVGRFSGWVVVPIGGRSGNRERCNHWSNTLKKIKNPEIDKPIYHFDLLSATNSMVQSAKLWDVWLSRYRGCSDCLLSYTSVLSARFGVTCSGKVWTRQNLSHLVEILVRKILCGVWNFFPPRYFSTTMGSIDAPNMFICSSTQDLSFGVLCMFVASLVVELW